jgi:nitrate/TMAO reductase-like tetraheme cytochrome c subunit
MLGLAAARPSICAFFHKKNYNKRMEEKYMPNRHKPTNQNRSKGVKRVSVVLVLAAIFAAGVLFSAGGFAFAATQESHDSFCASCHTQPESTFYERSTGQPVDLASFHTPQQARCIDCHSGHGVSGRITAELLGAGNALKWYTGTAVQPAPLTKPIADENCLKCHQDVTARGFAPKEDITISGVRFRREAGEEGGTGHWHQLLARWQSKDTRAATCVSCHGGHQSGQSAQAGFMDASRVVAQCSACHEVLREEE